MIVTNRIPFTIICLFLTCFMLVCVFMPFSAQAAVVDVKAQISTFSQYVRALNLGDDLSSNLTNPFLSSMYLVYQTSTSIYRSRFLMPFSLGVESSSRNPSLPGQKRDYLYLSSKFLPASINADTPNGEFVTDTRLYAVPTSSILPPSYTRMPYIADVNFKVADDVDNILFLTLSPVLSNTAELLSASNAVPYGISFGTFTEDKSSSIAERCCYLRFRMYFVNGNIVLEEGEFLQDLLTFDYDLKFVYDATRIKPLPSTGLTPSTPISLSFSNSLVSDVNPADMQVFPGAKSAVEAYFNFIANANGYEQGYQDGYNTGHQEGYNEGYQDGIWEGENIVSSTSASYNQGYTNGFDKANSTVNKTSASYNAGYTAGVNAAGEYTFSGLIGAVLDGPVNAFMQFFNFELFGVNLTGLLSALFVLCIAITILRLVLGG